MSEDALCAARGEFGWLALAAAPVFALMALWSARFPEGAGLCGAMRGASPLNEMTLMYLLMSALHVAPWLRWLRR